MILNGYKLFYGTFVKKEYELTPKELKLLTILSDNQMHTSEELVEECDFLSIQSLRNYIRMLREKQVLITNLYKCGYRMETKIKDYQEIL